MKTTIYFHSDKASMREDFEDLCEPLGRIPTSTAINEAMRVGYEIEIEGDWNLDDGKFYATHLMGVKLETPVEL